MNLEEKPLPPPQVPSGSIADRTAKYDLPDGNLSDKTDRFPSKKIYKKKEKKDSKLSNKKMKAPGSEEDDVPRGFSFVNQDVDREVRFDHKTSYDYGLGDRKTSYGDYGDDRDVSRGMESVGYENRRKDWQMDQLEKSFHLKALFLLLSSDPVLGILRPKLIGPIRGPVTAIVMSTNKLNMIRALNQVLEDAGFIPGAFDANDLLDCDINHIVAAGKALMEKLEPVVGIVPAKVATGKAINTPGEFHTGSSQYASAESDEESDESVNI